jgi:hypothetical protein
MKKLMIIMVEWFGLPCFIFIFNFLILKQPVMPASIPVGSVDWTNHGPIPYMQINPPIVTLETVSKDPLAWLGPDFSKILNQIADFALLSLPGFFAWLITDFVETEDKEYEASQKRTVV